MKNIHLDLAQEVIQQTRSVQTLLADPRSVASWMLLPLSVVSAYRDVPKAEASELPLIPAAPSSPTCVLKVASLPHPFCYHLSLGCISNYNVIV